MQQKTSSSHDTAFFNQPVVTVSFGCSIKALRKLTAVQHTRQDRIEAV